MEDSVLNFLNYEGLEYYDGKSKERTDEKIAVETERAKNAEETLDSKKIDKTTVATTSTLGLVKSGTDITVDSSGNVSVKDNSHKHTVSNISDLTATASELNVLDGITSTTTELNKLHGTTATVDDFNKLHDVTASASELNIMDGVTATTTELNYVDGVTSNIQTQLNSKQPNITGGATTITSSNLTASRALISNSSGKVAVSDVTSTELGYLDGATSNIQTQLNAKAPLASPTLTGTPKAPTATAGTNSTQIATTAFVTTAVANGIAASDAMIVKGTIGTSGTVTSLPTTYKTGWTYRVVTAGTYAGQVCEIGDLIVALVDRSGSGNVDSDWCVAQTNINGAITGVKSGDAYITTSQSGSVVTITHKDVTRTNTTSTASPTHGGTFTAVKTVTSDAKGHVTGVDTETVTLPSAYTHPSYTARTGVPTANQTPAFGGTFSVSQPVSDATGHITAMNSRTITIPSAVATTSSAGLESAADKTKLDGIATGAEVNQNAFSNVVVGSTTISADTKTDSLTLAGSNVTITPDATNDKVTIGITKANVTSALGYTPPTTNTTYGVATTSENGLMSSTDKAKLDSTNVAYGTCSTAASTAAKTVDLDDTTSFSLVNGASIKVKFTNGNSVNSPTLNINSTGAKYIKYAGNTLPSSYIKANCIYEFVYDSSSDSYIFNGDFKETYTNATTSANGLMSSADKAKLNYTNIAYGTCSTAAATAAKVITISGNTNWALTVGSRITVKFSYTNTASNPTFNVNGTGAKSVWYNTALITTSNLGYAGTANRPMDFVYDGTQYIFVGWSIDSNTTYSNATLGQGYGTCATAEATTAKVVTLSSYSLVTGGIVAVKFTYAVPASATMNINSKGAKNIYYRGSVITAGVIKAGDIGVFIYDGTQYHLLTVDRDNNTTYTLSSFGITATATELNYVDGVTSSIQSQLDGKAATSHGTHVTYGTTTPLVAGTGAVGTSSGLARIDHVHPAQTTVSGNAGTATKLATARTIDGVSFNGTAAITHYGTCSTAAATAAKTVALTGFTLATGARVLVKFTVTNTAASPTLNVNSTGAKAIMYRGSAITAGYLAANRVYEFVYDGTDWELIGDINTDTNTTYTSLKNPYALTIQGNGTTLTNGTYDGSAAKTVNITPSSIGAAASSHTHSYLPLTGGTLTGNLTVPKLIIDNTTTALEDGVVQNMLQMYYKDAGEQTFTVYPIRVVGSTQTSPYNAGVLLGSNNGTTIVGAGESSGTMPAAINAYNNEHLYLTADGQIKMYTGCANDASSYTEALVIANNGSATFVNTVTAPTFVGALTGTATKVQNTYYEPTTETWYAPAFLAGGNSTGSRTLGTNNAYSLGFNVGTTDAVGRMILALGNSTASGTAGNQRGCIRIYDTNSYYVNFYAGNSTLTASRNIYLPNASGTVALTSSPSHITPTTAVTYDLGSATLPWRYNYSKGFEIYGAASKNYGYLRAYTVGTTTTTGETRLVLGNNVASGTDSNSCGNIYAFGTSTYYTKLTFGTQTANRTITFPNATGTVMLTSAISSSLASTSTTNVLSSAGAKDLQDQITALNSNKVDMLADGEYVFYGILSNIHFETNSVYIYIPNVKYYDISLSTCLALYKNSVVSINSNDIHIYDTGITVHFVDSDAYAGYMVSIRLTLSRKS